MRENAFDRATVKRILDKCIPGPPPSVILDRAFDEACKALARESGL
jgi:hypothetical protein